MAITIDRINKVISIPKADTTLVSSTPDIRSIDVDTLRLALKVIEASEEGMPFDDTHVHTPPVTFAGVTLARIVEIINGHTITFEDGQYAVNIVGGNSNIADVTNVNQVSLRSFNSAGLVQVTSGSGVTSQDKTDIANLTNAGSEALKKTEFLALK